MLLYGQNIDFSYTKPGFYCTILRKRRKVHGEKQTRGKTEGKGTARGYFFPFQHYLADFCPPSAGLPLHWHPEMEFTKILEGTAVYSIDFQEYPVQAGDYVCVQPGLLHGARMAPSAFLHSDTFVFHLNFLGSSSADICTLKYFSPVMEGNLRFPQVISRNDPLYPKLDGLFQALSSCYQRKEDGYELEIKALLLRWYACC